MDFLTTSEAAEYLRMGERKLYELVAESAIPCSKMAGKWLFPRHELDRWIMSGLIRPGGMMRAEPPPIVGGSQDDLLEWALRQSGSGLASLTEGSEKGLDRLLRGEVAAAAIHFHDGESGEDANIEAVSATPQLHDAVLVGLTRREQGLLLQPGNPRGIGNLGDVLAKGAKMAMRQPGAGARMLLDVLLAQAGASQNDLNCLEPPCLTGPDLAAAISSGLADCGIATRSAARTASLDFVPLIWEHFDLVMRQRTYFQPPLQALITFLTRNDIGRYANEMAGYDTSVAGKIRHFT